MSATTRSPGAKSVDALAGLDYGSRLLMAKERGRNDHARVIAAAKDLEVGAAGERSAHLDDQLARRGLGNGDLLDADIFAPVEDGGLHGAAPVEERVLDCLAAQADGGFDLLAAFDDDRLDGIQAGFDDRLDSIQAALDDVLDFLAALFDNRLRRSCGRGGSRAFTVLAIIAPPWLCSCSRHRLNHNLHGAGLGVRSDLDGFHRLLPAESGARSAA